MGAKVEEKPDGLEIPGQQKLHGATIDSLGDHRIAMAFAVAVSRAPTVSDDADRARRAVQPRAD